MNRFKILFVIDSLEIGGAEQSLLDNITRFKKLVPVVCHLYDGDTLKERFVAHGIKVYSVGLKSKYGFVSAFRRLRKIMRDEQPGLVVAYLSRSEFVSRIAARLQGIPVAGTFVSDLYAGVYNKNLSLKAKAGVRFFKLINKLTARLCTGFIANSAYLKSAQASHLGIPSEKIQVIYRGRDSSVFTFRPSSGLPATPIRFLHIGRLVPVKGQRELVLAFAAFLRQCPEAVLHIAGDGPCRQQLLQTIKDNVPGNKVLLLGSRSDIHQIIHQYDCFVLPSHSEGFPGSLVEAMLAGLPVLASDIPVIREIVTHNHTGYLFKPGSVQDIAEALLWFKENRQHASEMSVQAYQQALAHYELQTVAAQMETYLLSLISENCDYTLPGAKAAMARR